MSELSHALKLCNRAEIRTNEAYAAALGATVVAAALNDSVIPALPGYFVLYYDFEGPDGFDVQKDPIIAWIISRDRNEYNNEERFFDVRPITVSRCGDFSNNPWILGPDGQVCAYEEIFPSQADWEKFIKENEAAKKKEGEPQ